jgi:NTE family protein
MPFYSEQLRLGEVRENSQRVGIDLGLTGSLGELRIGPYAAGYQGEPEFGVLTSALPKEDITAVGLSLTGIVDQLDHVSFPTKGWFASFNVHNSDDNWHSDVNFTRGQVVLRGVHSIGNGTIGARLEWGENLSGELPVSELFQLGGPGRLSGLFLDQLTGRSYNLGVLSFHHRYAVLPPQLGRGVYVGFTAEAGRMDDPLMQDPNDWVTAGSIFWGADTVVGAIYLGYGYASLGQGTAYLMIGPDF